MSKHDITQLRLTSQLLSSHTLTTCLDVVTWMGAMQAQDYAGSMWAIGARLPEGHVDDVADAFERGQIVRTWPMRGTLHIIAATDARWMLTLLTPRVLSAYGYRMRYHGITLDVYAKARKLFEKEFQSGGLRTREELYAVLERGGIATANSLGLHIIGRLALEQVICGGPRRGSQPTYAAFDAWIPSAPTKTRDEGLHDIAIRYLRGHGPAQAQDLSWWAGLSLGDARRAITLASSELESFTHKDRVFYYCPMPSVSPMPSTLLLPPFDEYVVGYKDRSDCMDLAHAPLVNPGANGMLGAVVVYHGHLVGTWKKATKKSDKPIIVTPFEQLSSSVERGIPSVVERYQAFMNHA